MSYKEYAETLFKDIDLYEIYAKISTVEVVYPVSCKKDDYVKVKYGRRKHFQIKSKYLLECSRNTDVWIPKLSVPSDCKCLEIATANVLKSIVEEHGTLDVDLNEYITNVTHVPSNFTIIKQDEKDKMENPNQTTNDTKQFVHQTFQESDLYLDDIFHLNYQENVHHAIPINKARYFAVLNNKHLKDDGDLIQGIYVKDTNREGLAVYNHHLDDWVVFNNVSDISQLVTAVLNVYEESNPYIVVGAADAIFEPKTAKAVK